MLAPVSWAISLHFLTKSSSGHNSFGPQDTKFIPILADITINELATLFLLSPINTSLIPCKCPKFSSIVKASPNICVGWNSVVKPFHTGTPAFLASSSTIFCENPLYSIPSYILPSTLAVSAILSFLPIWELPGSRYVTPIPKSKPATSNEHLVLVDVFSNSRTIFLPFKYLWSIPLCFFSFKSFDKSNKYLISSGV